MNDSQTGKIASIGVTAAARFSEIRNKRRMASRLLVMEYRLHIRLRTGAALFWLLHHD